MTQPTAMTEQEQEEIEDIFLKLLEKESSYYHVILDLTRNEGDKLENARPFGEIQKLLRKKKIILSCIEEIEVSLAPLKRYWIQDKKRDTVTAKKIQSQIKHLSSTVKDILQQDQRNQKTLKQYMLNIKSHQTNP